MGVCRGEVINFVELVDFEESPIISLCCPLHTLQRENVLREVCRNDGLPQDKDHAVEAHPSVEMVHPSDMSKSAQ